MNDDDIMFLHNYAVTSIAQPEDCADVEKLEKIKRMTSETYDEIARVTNAAWEEQEDNNE